MTVKEFIEKLKDFPQDMEIVVIGDYIGSPNPIIERYADGFDSQGELIIKQRVEIH